MNNIFGKKIDWLILVIVAIIFVVSFITLLPRRGSPLSLDQEGVYFVSGKEEFIFIPLEEPWIVRTEYTKPVEKYVFQKLTKASKVKKVGKWLGVIGPPITFAGKFIHPYVFCLGFGVSTTGAVFQFVGKDKKPTLEPTFLHILEVGVGKESFSPLGGQTLLALGDELSVIENGFLLQYGEKIAGVDPEYVTIVKINGKLMGGLRIENGKLISGGLRIEEGSQGNIVVIFDGHRYENRFILIEVID